MFQKRSAGSHSHREQAQLSEALCGSQLSVEVRVRVSERRLKLHGQTENDIRAAGLFFKHVHNREIDSVQNTEACEDRTVIQEFGSAVLTASHRSCYRSKVLAQMPRLVSSWTLAFLITSTGTINRHIQHSGEQNGALDLHVEDQLLCNNAVS